MNTFKTALLITGISISISCGAQQANGTRITLGQALSAAGNNLQLEINKDQIQRGKTMIHTSTVFARTGLFVENEDLRPSDKKGIMKIGLSQSVAWPGLYKAQRDVYRVQLEYHKLNTAVLNAEIARNVRSVYYQLWYLQDKHRHYNKLDSIYRSLAEASKLKVKAGDSPGLDSIAANVRRNELQAMLQQIITDIEVQQQSLMQLLNSDTGFLAIDSNLEKLAMPVLSADSVHPLANLQKQNVNIANAGVSVVKNENRPEFSGRFFSQRLYGLNDPFSGFSVSVAIPLFGTGANRSKVKAAQEEAGIQQKQYEYRQQLFKTEFAQAEKEVRRNNTMLAFYETTGLKQAEQIISAAGLAYRTGEISFAELSQFLTQAIDIQRNYLENLNAYNQSVIQLYYFNNQ